MNTITTAINPAIQELNTTINTLSRFPSTDKGAACALMIATTARAYLRDALEAETLAVTPTPKSHDMEQLHSTIEFMDCLAQGGFSEISAIAKLALAALETPDGHRHPETIAHALRAIWGKADDIENCINSEAEEVGCNYSDPSTALRYQARRDARQEEMAGAK